MIQIFELITGQPLFNAMGEDEESMLWHHHNEVEDLPEKWRSKWEAGVEHCQQRMSEESMTLDAKTLLTDSIRQTGLLPAKNTALARRCIF